MMCHDHDDALLATERNCWRIESADQVGLVISGEAYFRAVRQALLQAETHAFILAWDIHSSVELVRGDDQPDDGYPAKAGPFFRELLERKPDLQLHLLVWDFSMIYATEREWPLFSEMSRHPHPRLHMKYDDRLPLGASHHQKAVVVDDSFALVSGLDLSVWRWDTPERKLHDDRRVDPHGKPYAPYHDTGLAITGQAAMAIGDLCAERWQRATDEKLPRRESPRGKAPWPDEMDVAFEGIDVGIARTYAAFEPWPTVREVEQFHLDLIASARDYLYFENQYFSSHRLTRALASRLREENGPEVIIVITRDAGGQLEKGTMGLLRNRLFEILTEADQHGRLRFYYPQVTAEKGDETANVYVHAKIALADDRIVKIGTSNLSNRSMRVDSEVDLIIERPTPDATVRKWLHHFLALHFGTDAKSIAEQRESTDHLIELIEGMITERGHSLRPMPFGCKSEWERQLANSQLLDPDEPIDPEQLLHRMVPENERSSIARKVTQLSVVLLIGLLLAFFLKEGWEQLIDREKVIAFIRLFDHHQLAPLILIAVYFAVGMVGIPINLMVIAATVVVGPWEALWCGIIGAHLSALGGYGLGHHFGKKPLKRWAPESVNRLDRQLAVRGILPVVLVRILPVAPFVCVNLVAGASELKFRDFNFGTLLGMTPGMAIVVLLTHQLNLTVGQPSWQNILAFILVFAVAAGSIYFLRRALIGRSTKPAS